MNYLSKFNNHNKLSQDFFTKQTKFKRCCKTAKSAVIPFTINNQYKS